MLTIFTIPKPFQGHIDVIQRNAIRSWTLLRPRCEIILFGDEEGTAETAAEFGVRHVPDVACNEYGTPLLNGPFEETQHLAIHDALCYVNADIILLGDFLSAVQHIDFKRFLMVGQRWNVDIQKLWDFEQPDWDERLRRYIAQQGKLFSPAGIDYFVFPRGAVGRLPPFAIGRPGWDNWMIYRARASGIPVIDATPVATVIHQNHNYSHVPERRGDSTYGPEADRNIDLMGIRLIFSTADATYLLTPEGSKRALDPLHIRRNLVTLPVLYPRLRLPMRLLMKAINASHPWRARLGFTLSRIWPNNG